MRVWQWWEWPWGLALFLSTILLCPQLLCGAMVICPHKTVVCTHTMAVFTISNCVIQRAKSMKMLLDFINPFDSLGRYKLYMLVAAKLSGQILFLFCFDSAEVSFAL